MAVGAVALTATGPEPVMCSACGQAKPANAFYLVRGPLSFGDWTAQPCADCCRARVAAIQAATIEETADLPCSAEPAAGSSS